MKNIQFLSNNSDLVAPLVQSAPSDAPFTLSFIQTYISHIKAVKRGFDPVSECFGYVVGATCCCLMLGVQENEDSKPATRHDVIYADQERRRDQRELGDSFELGYCLGDAVVDTAAIGLGSVTCFLPALCRSLFNPLTSADSVCGVPPETIQDTKLFDACTCSSPMSR